MAGLLEAAGYEPASEPADADVVVLNTCTVREKAEDKVLSRIGELRSEARPGGQAPVIAVAGCMAQQDGAVLFRRARSVDVIVGTHGGAAPAHARRRGAPDRRAPDRRQSVRRRVVPAGDGAENGPCQGVRHHHRGLQRPLRVLRRAPHAGPRADASEIRDSRRGPGSGPERSDRNSPARPDRQPLPGARRPGLRLRGPAGGGRMPYRASRRIRFASPASPSRHGGPDRGDSRPAARVQAPPPPGPVGLDPHPRGDAAASHEGGVPRVWCGT